MLQQNTRADDYQPATPFECAMFSRLAYYSQLDQQRQNSKFWALEKPASIDFFTWRNLGWHMYGHCENGAGGYAGSAYLNESRKQLVIAHRGTDPYNLGAVFTDYHSIFRGHYSRQPDAAMDFTIKILKNLKAECKNSEGFNDYHLTFTGHSLGAWLSDVSVCKLKLAKVLNDSNLSAVTFDSPGSLSYLNQMTKDTTILQGLRIVNYLAAPNIVNICDIHVGRVYRIYPDIEEAGWLGINQHSMVDILNQFSANTHQVKNQSEVIKWPALDLKQAILNTESKLNTFYCYANKINNFDPENVEKLQNFYQIQNKIVPLPVIVHINNHNSIRNNLRKLLNELETTDITLINQKINYLTELEKILLKNLAKDESENHSKYQAILFSSVWEIFYDINHLGENFGKISNQLACAVLKVWLNIIECGIILNFAQTPVLVESGCYDPHHLIYRVAFKDKEILTNTVDLILQQSYADNEFVPNEQLILLSKNIKKLFNLLPYAENKFFTWLQQMFKYSQDKLSDLNKLFSQAVEFRQLLKLKDIELFIENVDFSYQIIILYQTLGKLYATDVNFNISLLFGDISNQLAIGLADFIEDKKFKINIEEIGSSLIGKAIESFVIIWNYMIDQQHTMQNTVKQYAIFREQNSLFHYVLTNTNFTKKIEETVIFNYYKNTSLKNLIEICDQIEKLQLNVKANHAQANLLIKEVVYAKFSFEKTINIELNLKQIEILSELHNILKSIYEFVNQYCDRYWFSKIIYSGSDACLFAKYSKQLNDRLHSIDDIQIRCIPSIDDYAKAEQQDIDSIRKCYRKLINLQQIYTFCPEGIERLSTENSIVLIKNTSTSIDAQKYDNDKTMIVITKNMLLKIDTKYQTQQLQMQSIKLQLDNIIQSNKKQKNILPIEQKWHIPLYKINKLSCEPWHQQDYASIYLGEYENKAVVVKFFPKFTNEAQIKSIITAIDNLSKLSCKHLCKFHGASIEEDMLFVMTEYYAQGNLRMYLSQKDLNFMEKQKIMLELCYGLQYLHEQEISDCNLLTNHVLIDDSGSVKISNFCLSSKLFKQCNMQTNVIGQKLEKDIFPKHTPGRDKVNKSQDIYMLSSILLEMITGDFSGLVIQLLKEEEKAAQVKQSIFESSEEFKPLVPVLFRNLNNAIEERSKIEEIITKLEYIALAQDDKNAMTSIEKFPTSNKNLQLIISNSDLHSKKDFFYIGDSPRSQQNSGLAQRYQDSASLLQPILSSSPQECVLNLDIFIENGIYPIDLETIDLVIDNLKQQEVFDFTHESTVTDKLTNIPAEMRQNKVVIKNINATASCLSLRYTKENLSEFLNKGIGVDLKDDNCDKKLANKFKYTM